MHVDMGVNEPERTGTLRTGTAFRFEFVQPECRSCSKASWKTDEVDSSIPFLVVKVPSSVSAVVQRSAKANDLFP